ncbi:MAG: lipocalin family protein [Paludibacteraceae bacterium]|jgi:hypothetical protein|nr:lipocalin family protein [Paludibacteraceae bacterium]
MKKNLILCLVMFMTMGVMFTSCNSSSSTSEGATNTTENAQSQTESAGSGIEGKWKIVTIEEYHNDNYEGKEIVDDERYIDFKQDGNVTVIHDGEVAYGSYIQDGDKIITHENGKNDALTLYIKSLTSDELVVENRYGESLNILTFKRVN